MTVKLASLKADLAKEAEGEWIESQRFPGVRWLLRSLNEPQFRIARDLLLQRLGRQHGRKAVPPDVLAAEFGKLYARHLVLGWDGLDVAWSPDVASATLSDPAYREVVQDIEASAAQVAQLQVEFVEDAEKN